MMGPDDILKFWLDDCGPERWFKQNAALDQQITDLFATTRAAAAEGTFALWLTYPNGALAYIILMDQFPRNMFRQDARAFATDRAALAAAKSAIAKGWDLRVDPPARQFFYMPLEHSENLSDQDRAVRLISTRLQDVNFMLHAQAHREVIRTFGRFPYRNAMLGRKSTQSEQAHLDKGGYAAILRNLKSQAA